MYRQNRSENFGRKQASASCCAKARSRKPMVTLKPPSQYLRKKGLSAQSKKSGRETKEGLIGIIRAHR